ncbi:MAG: DUF1648 domain-containing protein [Cyclobacteriaceae bacterium]
MSKVFQLLRIGSSILLIIVLLFVYANLPEQVAVHANNSGSASSFLSKNDFFYFTLLAFIGLNLLVFGGGKMLEQLPVNAAKFLFASESFKENILAWWTSFSSIINLFLIFIIGFIGVFNSSDDQLISSYAYLAYVGQFLIIIWLITLIYLLYYRDR